MELDDFSLTKFSRRPLPSEIDQMALELAEWQELYYYLFGTVRNEIRTGGEAYIRLDHIWDILKKSREKHLELERKYDEADTD